MFWLLAACQPSVETPFDASFRWGVASAGFQVEAGCPSLAPSACEDRNSDWYDWVTDPAVIADPATHVAGDPLADGPGWWEQSAFEADVARAAADGMRAFRLGLEWSRLFPEDASDATSVDDLAERADPVAVARYHEMLATLREHGLEPMVTVNHYTMPRWVHDGLACRADLAGCGADGWVTRERILPLIRNYTGFVAREFGGEVDRWATLNEPMALVLAGYVFPTPDRTNPPGLAGEAAAGIAVLHNQIEGSALMYEAIHAEDAVDADGDGSSATVGLVMNVVDVLPKDESKADDLRGVAHLDHLYHGLFFDALVDGRWDADVDGVYEATRPELAGHLDWVGVNFYATIRVAGLPMPLVPAIAISDFYPEINWNPEDGGMRRVLQRVAPYGLPIEITENGFPSDVPEERAAALDRALVGVRDARGLDGLDVRSFYYWSLVDNYEWNHGMGLRFGLYSLDESKQRTPTVVLERYRAIVADGGVSL